jgi:MFS family permease
MIRVIAPHFGTSAIVWSNILAIALTGLAIGNKIGGHLADRYPNPRVLFLITLIAAFSLVLLSMASNFISEVVLSYVLQNVSSSSNLILFGSLTSSVSIFLMPLICLGCVSPFVIRLVAQANNFIGLSVGRVYATSSIGGVVSLLLVPFLMEPILGVQTIFYLFSFVLSVVSIVGFIKN